MPHAGKRAEIFLAPLNAAMAEFSIDTPLAVAAFLAQLCHESGSLVYVKELASGQAYEGRKDLGNTQVGDGVRFRGRGLIQITGRANYQRLSDELVIDCVSHPELLEIPINACRSAAWFWNSRHLSDLAEAGTDEAFRMITKKVNGGYNGLAERLDNYARAKKVLGV